MCGICGFVGESRPDTLTRMRDALTHRGPNEADSYTDSRVQLGHRRLSIIDLKDGRQPFVSDDGSIVVVFNGEIYNHAALRTRLEDRGHRFRTRSDTESIIHAYREYRDDCPRHLDGMFAFVLYDRTRKILLGARDRFGKKPFFYSLPKESGGRAFVFGSEIRSLLMHPAVSNEKALSESAIVSYLFHDYLPGEMTPFEGLSKLLPGHAFRIDTDKPAPAKLKTWRYWQNPIASVSRSAVSEPDAIAAVDHRLDAAVQKRLMSDVPLGVFLSGGIDSSAILAFMSRHIAPADIQTFSIGFEDPSFDESGPARAAADFFGTHHRQRKFAAGEALDEMQRCFDHMDEPLADPSLIPSSLLAHFAGETITVALGGDGGDELFAGYDPFKAIRAARTYHGLVPRWADEAFAGIARLCLPNSGANMSLAFRAERFLRGARETEELRMATWMGAFSPAEFPLLAAGATGAQLRDRYFDRERECFASLHRQEADPIRQGLAYFQNFYLADDILVKADRASMMNSLELRSPFLDTDLAEYVNNLPSRFKYRSGTTKYILKRLLANRGSKPPMIPEWLLTRRKKGFGIPVSRWIRKELEQEFRTRLVSEWPAALNFLNVRHIETLLSKHIAGTRDYWKELWALYVLGEWARRWAA